MSKFKNDAIPRPETDWRYHGKERHDCNVYGFMKAPKLLMVWSRLFQSTIAQAGTFLLTGAFNDGHLSIYKSEGGCRIQDVGELVLGSDSCYWDGGSREEKTSHKMAQLITAVVMEWNPNDPIESMMKSAGKFLFENCPKEWRVRTYKRGNADNEIRKRPGWREKDYTQKVKESIEKSKEGGPFSGNALSNFFDWNPFSKAPLDRDYLRFCMVKFDGKTEAEVDQQFADEDLGDANLEKINAAIRTRNPGRYASTALCCYPRRSKEGLLTFRINTGGSSPIDGWKTQQEIEDFIAGKELVQS